MTIAFVADASATAAAQSITVTKPAGVASGDVLIAYCVNQGDNDWNTPSGWNVGRGYDVVGSTPALSTEWFWKVAGSSEPADYTFTHANPFTQRTAAVILAYRNVDAAAIDVTGLTKTTGSTSATAPSVTTTKNAELVICLWAETGALESTSCNLAPPGTVTEREDVAYSGVAINAAEFSQASPGATGAKVAAGLNTTGNIGDQVALFPALPTAPTLVSPANASTVDLAAGFTADWTFTHPLATETQSGYYLRRKLSGGGTYDYWNAGTAAFQSTEVKNTSSSDQVTFASGKWSNGSTYNWSVATEDSNNNKSAYASDFTVTGSTPATVTVSAPTGTVTDTTQPTVTWSITDPESDAQQTYQVKVESGAYGTSPGSGTQAWDSTEVTSTSTSVAIGTPLTNGVTYRAFVRVKTAGQYSSWAYSTFTISLDAPAVPTLTATADNPNNRVTLAVQGRDNLLSTNDASIETNASGWTPDNDTASGYPQRSTAQALKGSASLLMRASVPASIAGLKLWLRADAITALNDNDPVTTWADQSGNGTDATQATAAKKPTYKTNILNGKPVVRFDGVDDLLRTAAVTTISQPTTVFVVAKATGTGFWIDNRDTGLAHSFYRGDAVGDKAVIYAGTAEVVESDLTGGSFRVFAGVFNGASSKVYQDGGTPGTGDAGSNGTTGWTAGAARSDVAYLNGDIAEVIFYSGALSVADMNRVGNYLESKYALTWTDI